MSNDILCSISEIREKVYELGLKICIPKERLHVFDVSPGDGRPHISFDNNRYNYIYEERGVEFEIKSTDDVNELLYWIMSDVVYGVAFQYELEHRIEHVDGRRIVFPRVVQLMSKLNSSWASRAHEEIIEILARNPYSDS
ncbi:immunity 63 family protein [Dickeya zeae]|uniref:Imm63 family immunity protein n=1 Tax=Dickeya zeae TaxID=204042 RepID=UPI001CFBB200|nr:Imm63 family immunity protein [Dickeya zeae]UCZ73547.1 immunity 63 family protein [Dickeya zeae]